MTTAFSRSAAGMRQEARGEPQAALLDRLHRLIDQISTIIVGKRRQIEDAWPACWPAAIC